MGHIDETKLNQLFFEIQSGNQTSFSEFYQLTKSLIYYTVLPIIKDSGLAEDLLQEVYIKLIENSEKKKSQGSMIAYIITIARHLAINDYKRRQKEALYDRQIMEASIGQKESIILDESPVIQKMYQLLNETDIEIVTQHVLNDLTFKDISIALKMPLGTVLWRYNQAIKKLQKGVASNEKN